MLPVSPEVIPPTAPLTELKPSRRALAPSTRAVPLSYSWVRPSARASAPSFRPCTPSAYSWKPSYSACTPSAKAPVPSASSSAASVRSSSVSLKSSRSDRLPVSRSSSAEGVRIVAVKSSEKSVTSALTSK